MNPADLTESKQRGASGNGFGASHALPCALFVGDFNVGKSALINALLKREALFEAREESQALPTFVGRSDGAKASYAALAPGGAKVDAKTHEEFLNIRRHTGNEAGYTALSARLPASPFSRLVLVDSAGLSSDSLESLAIDDLTGLDNALFAIVADIEYWSAKHTMDFIAENHERFGSSLLVVANKADHLNANELNRIITKAPQRMERYGIAPAPRFFAVSARLELARGGPKTEYRARVKKDVRERCDAGFDALRVALYEFEAARMAGASAPTFDTILGAPLVSSFIALQEGSHDEVSGE